MNPLYSLILASKTKEGLFAAFWLALGEKPGTFAAATFAALTATAARYGANLTESQVRKRVKELETLGLVALVPQRERGRFDFSVFAPRPQFAVSVAVSATEAAANAKTEQTVEVVENVAETPKFERLARPAAVPATNAPARENNNKYKNKKINNPAIILETSKSADASPAETPERAQNGSESVRDVADVRQVVDFAAPRVAAFRRLVARKIWERSTRPDLVDRLTAACALGVGGTTPTTVKSMINDACEAVALYKRTDGKRGKERVWQTLTLEIKRIYESAGWHWSPTRPGIEPRPRELDRQTLDVEVV